MNVNPNTGRFSIFAVVGAYLIYLAYGMLKDKIDQVPTTMPPFLQILFIALFTGVGIALLFFAWKFWKKGREDQDQNPVDIEDQDATSASEKSTQDE